MKKRYLSISSLFLAAFSVHAVSPGMYLGVMVGPATNSGERQMAQVEGMNALTPVTPRSKQFGSRLYLGYQFNPYASLEGGLTYYSTINYDSKGVTTCSSVNTRFRDFDLLVKGSLPLASFNVFAKAGAAAVYQTNSGALNPNYNFTCGHSTYTTNFRPLAAIGASYDISQRVVTDISYTYTNVGGKIHSLGFLAIGISYHFVDVYCGQFLCD